MVLTKGYERGNCNIRNHKGHKESQRSIRMQKNNCMYMYMVELHETEKPIFTIINTMSMSRQYLGLTTQFPSQSMG